MCLIIANILYYVNICGSIGDDKYQQLVIRKEKRENQS